MKRAFEALTIFILLTIVGCSHSVYEGGPEEPTEVEITRFYFTLIIKETYDGGTTLVDGARGKVLVTLSVNDDETFHEDDKEKSEIMAL